MSGPHDPFPVECPSPSFTFSPGSLVPLLQVHHHIFDALLSISPARFATLSRLCHSRSGPMLYRKLDIGGEASIMVFYGLFGSGRFFAVIAFLFWLPLKRQGGKAESLKHTETISLADNNAVGQLKLTMRLHAMNRSWWDWWQPVPRAKWLFRNVTHLRLDAEAVKRVVDDLLQEHDLRNFWSGARYSSLREGERMLQELEMAPKSICLELDLANPKRRGGYWFGDILLGALVPAAGIKTVTIHLQPVREKHSTYGYREMTMIPTCLPLACEFVFMVQVGSDAAVEEAERREQESLDLHWEQFKDLVVVVGSKVCRCQATC